MFFKCKFNDCGFESDKKEDFVEHVKTKHSLKISDYCERFDKKFDLFTGEPIKFKSLDQYLLTNFCNKKNMLSWLKKNKETLSSQYLSGCASSHSIIKSVSNFPSCSEIRAISYMPSLKTYEFFFPELNDFIDSIGLKRRYDYNLNEKKLNYISAKNITIDTREQKPLNFKGIESSFSKLEFGDYSSYFLLAVERKSLGDLVSTLCSGFDRFKREIERAKSSGGYIVVVSDCDINQFLSFNYSRQGRFSKASIEFVLHRFRDILRCFPDHVQFCFSGGRKRSSEIIAKILGMTPERASSLDFQYLIEKSLI